MSLLGGFLIWGSFFLLLYATLISLAARRTMQGPWSRSACRALQAAAAFVVLACGLLVTALLRCDFSLEYVAAHTSTTLPPLYRATALWAGQAGSLLVWLSLLLVFTAATLPSVRRKAPHALPGFLLLGSTTGLFFTLLLLVFDSPFAHLAQPALEGRGMNPLLQNPGMVLHPPLLFVGYVGFALPCAWAVGSLLSGDRTGRWIVWSRGWTLASWLFLTAGIVLGAQWAYVELGWGGYWAWDPVENASLLPWLSATAFLHTARLQERRGLFPVWNAALAGISFLLCIFGTFLTRSGFIESVHAFSRSSIGYYFLAFLGLAGCALAILVLLRGASPHRVSLTGLLTREGALATTHLLLLGLLAVVFLGTLWPTLSEALLGQKIAVGAHFFNRAAQPFCALVLFLLALCPALGWRPPARDRRTVRTVSLVLGGAFLAVATCRFLAGADWGSAILAGLSLTATASLLFDLTATIWTQTRARKEGSPLAETIHQNRRRWAAHLVHVGLALFCLGVAGSAYHSRTFEFEASPGQTLQAGPYQLFFEGITLSGDKEKDILEARLRLARDGKSLGLLTPARHYHRLFEQPMTEVDFRTTPTGDVYVIFEPLDSQGRSSIRVLLNPLVFWIWAGGCLMALGGTLGLFPGRPRNPAPRKQPSENLEVCV